MRRALQLAARGRGYVEPNPMVGCVIARGDRIIGEGWHRQFGGPHAEREALANCTEPPAGATAYVTLEPCCYTDKKTPPCVPAMIEAKLGRIAIACADPNPDVSGEGIRQLRAAGLHVETGLLEPEAKQLNAAFFKVMLTRRPYVTLKWAQTADGKVAGPGGQRMQISNGRSMRIVHELRSKCDAIVVGINTVLSDDPMLTARTENPPRTPIRIVLDTSLCIPMSCRLVATAKQSQVMVYCSAAAYQRDADARAKELDAHNVRILPHTVSLSGVLDDLHALQVTHMLVEPGPTLACSFLEQNLADRVWIFQSPRRIDCSAAPTAPAVDWPISAEVNIDGDRLVEMLNPAGPAFFAALPSADFPLL